MKRRDIYFGSLISLIASVTVFFTVWLSVALIDSINQVFIIVFLVPILAATTLSLIAGYFFIRFGPEEKLPFALVGIPGTVIFFLGASTFAIFGNVAYCQTYFHCGDYYGGIIFWPIVWLASPLIGIIIAFGMEAGWRLKKRKGGVEMQIKEAPADEPPLISGAFSNREGAEMKRNVWPAILFIPGVMLLCILIPIVYNAIREFNIPWEEIPPPPAKPQKLLGIGEAIDSDSQIDSQKLVILAQDGKIYSFYNYSYETFKYDNYSNSSEGTWSLDSETEYWGDECEFPPMYVLFWSSLFFSRSQCVQESPPCFFELCMPYSYHFILDKNGSIWYRVQPTQFYPPFNYIILIISSLPGLIIGLVLFLIFWRRPRKKKDTHGEGMV